MDRGAVSDRSRPSRSPPRRPSTRESEEVAGGTQEGPAACREPSCRDRWRAVRPGRRASGSGVAAGCNADRLRVHEVGHQVETAGSGRPRDRAKGPSAQEGEPDERCAAAGQGGRDGVARQREVGASAPADGNCRAW